MSNVERVSPLVIAEATLCFGPVGVLWLWGGWALAGGLFHAGTVSEQVVLLVALGGLGLLGAARLVIAASRGVHGVGAWSLLLVCLASGLAALVIAGPLPIVHRPLDPADIVFILLPAVATVHLLLVAVARSRASGLAKRSG